ncbi:MAG: aspartate aminotransferase, partial [Bacteroidetes bacterium]
MQLHPRVKSLKPSATLAINERSAELVAAGQRVYRLGFGQSPFPVPAEVVKALQDHAHRKDYLPVRGLPELRAAVATFNRRTQGIACAADQVLIGPGSKELIYDLLLATDADLLLPSPSWVSYEPQARLANKAVHWIDTHQSDAWQLTPAALEQACQNHAGTSKVLILNYPNNPTGVSYTGEQLAALAAVARQYGVLIVADEIYGEVDHTGQHRSLARYYPEGTIVSSGLSKWCGAGGWRLGTFTFPREYLWLLDAMATIASETFTSVSAPIQWAAVTAYQGSPETVTYVAHSRRILAAVANYTYLQLQALHLQMPPAAGGFYLFPDFEHYRKPLAARGITTSVDLCEQLLTESGVALLPGVAFGRPATELTARLSFVDFNGEQLLHQVAAQPEEPLDGAWVAA